MKFNSKKNLLRISVMSCLVIVWLVGVFLYFGVDGVLDLLDHHAWTMALLSLVPSLVLMVVDAFIVKALRVNRS